MGYLAELFRFPDWCTADELLGLHQDLAGSAGGRDERRALLELVELDHVPDRRVGTMSKGMQQRLGLAQAMIGAPKLLLLDEPTSALDPAGRRTVRTLLERLRARGVAVLLNSHLLSEVELVCDRVAIIDGGVGRRRRHAGRAQPSRRRRGRDRVRRRGASRPRRATTRRRSCATSSPPGRTSSSVRVRTSTLEDAYLEAVGRGPAPSREEEAAA